MLLNSVLHNFNAANPFPLARDGRIHTKVIARSSIATLVGSVAHDAVSPTIALPAVVVECSAELVVIVVVVVVVVVVGTRGRGRVGTTNGGRGTNISQSPDDSTVRRGTLPPKAPGTFVSTVIEVTLEHSPSASQLRDHH